MNLAIVHIPTASVLCFFASLELCVATPLPPDCCRAEVLGSAYLPITDSGAPADNFRSLKEVAP